MIRTVAVLFAALAVACAKPLHLQKSGEPLKLVSNPSTEPNMNGIYTLSGLTPGAKNVSGYSTEFRDYPGGVEYFDVVSPLISQYYSQVFWTQLPGVKLPQDIIDRFDNKAMAVVGFEMDQVRIVDGKEVSVPINVVYNHHFESTMTGKHSSMKKIKINGPHDPRIPQTGHGHNSDTEAWIVEDHKPDSANPTSVSFGAGNGGEFRMSMHARAFPYVQTIESPDTFYITPMQIDTWNRDEMNLTGSKFVAGPLPKESLAPQDAEYSGLLECPLTTRVTKLVEGNYHIQVGGKCNDSVTDRAQCFGAATKQLNLPASVNITDKQVNDASLPAGCLLSQTGPSELTVIFNSATTGNTATCGQDTTSTVGFSSSLVDLALTIDSAKDEVTINMTGPSDVWFGVGFNATAMKDAPWAVIVLGNGTVEERKLADQNPGTQLANSVTVVSHEVVGSKRTVVMTRKLAGLTNNHFTFDMQRDTLLNFINAIGNSVDLAYHANRTGSSIVLLPAESSQAACLCAVDPEPFGSGKGSLVYEDGTTIGFGNKCAPQPRSDLLAQHNPTCDVRTYVGGQTACHHKWYLLDKDQELPWQDQPLEYHMKFRFWFQDFDPAHHIESSRVTWGIASPVEYDVPKCAEGTPVEECVHTITGTFDINKAPKGQVSELVAAHFHCHAPTCLSITLYNNITGDVLCEERPIYGGNGGSPAKFDEPGYIAQPPCLWSHNNDGLATPPIVSGQTLHAVAKTNNTNGHHGEMAWLQVFYANVPASN